MGPSGSTARALLRSFSLCLGLLALFIYGAVSNDQFLTIDNQRDVLWQVSTNGIVAVGMTLVILTGGIDLSVGSVLSAATVVCAMLLDERGWNHAAVAAAISAAFVGALMGGWIVQSIAKRFAMAAGRANLAGWAGAMIIGLVAYLAVRHRAEHGFGVVGVLLLVPAFGLLLGAINGGIIAKGRLQPFIVTLAMMVSAVGLARFIAGGGGRIHAIYHETAPAAFFGLASNISVHGRELIPVPGIFFAASALLAAILARKTRAGRYIYAVGGNEEAGRYSGVNTDRVKILVYALSGLLAALAAVLYCAQYEQGKADAGLTRELDAIAAVVIGGTSLTGGRGGIGGTLIGVFIFGYLKNILNLRGVPTEFQQILQGVIIVLAVLLQEGTIVRWIREGIQRIRAAGKGSAPASK